MKRTEKSKANSRQKNKANSRKEKSKANSRQEKSKANSRQAREEQSHQQAREEQSQQQAREEQSQQQAREEQSQQQAEEQSMANSRQGKPKDHDRDKAKYEEKHSTEESCSQPVPKHLRTDADVQQGQYEEARRSDHDYPKIDFDEEIVEYKKIIQTAQEQRLRKSRRP